jgi:hypothetical protein
MANGFHSRAAAFCAAGLALAGLTAVPAQAQFMSGPYPVIVVPPPPAQQMVMPKKPKPQPAQDAEQPSAPAAPTCRTDPRTGACH